MKLKRRSNIHVISRAFFTRYAHLPIEIKDKLVTCEIVSRHPDGTMLPRQGPPPSSIFHVVVEEEEPSVPIPPAISDDETEFQRNSLKLLKSIAKSSLNSKTKVKGSSKSKSNKPGRSSPKNALLSTPNGLKPLQFRTPRSRPKASAHSGDAFHSATRKRFRSWTEDKFDRDGYERDDNAMLSQENLSRHTALKQDFDIDDHALGTLLPLDESMFNCDDQVDPLSQLNPAAPAPDRAHFVNEEGMGLCGGKPYSQDTSSAVNLFGHTLGGKAHFPASIPTHDPGFLDLQMPLDDRQGSNVFGQECELLSTGFKMDMVVGNFL